MYLALMLSTILGLKETQGLDIIMERISLTDANCIVDIQKPVQSNL